MRQLDFLNDLNCQGSQLERVAESRQDARTDGLYLRYLRPVEFLAPEVDPFDGFAHSAPRVVLVSRRVLLHPVADPGRVKQSCKVEDGAERLVREASERLVFNQSQPIGMEGEQRFKRVQIVVNVGTKARRIDTVGRSAAPVDRGQSRAHRAARIPHQIQHLQSGVRFEHGQRHAEPQTDELHGERGKLATGPFQELARAASVPVRPQNARLPQMRIVAQHVLHVVLDFAQEILVREPGYHINRCALVTISKGQLLKSNCRVGDRLLQSTNHWITKKNHIFDQ